MLPLSHDEVVYGKNLFLAECLVMNGKSLQIYDCYMYYMFTHPGTKLLFMDEFGQSAEWNFEGSLDWHLNEYPYHEG
jgi:1,4-alpha-glucan branching enzyme